MRPAMHDLGMQNGIAGALAWANQRKIDINPAVETIKELIKSTDDIMKEGKLSGIFTKAQQTTY